MKKNNYINIWDILDYKEEDYLEMIKNAGFDIKEEERKLGRYIDKLDYKLGMETKKNRVVSFLEWLDSKIANSVLDTIAEEELQTAFNRLKSENTINEQDLRDDLITAKYFEEYLASKEDEEGKESNWIKGNNKGKLIT